MGHYERQQNKFTPESKGLFGEFLSLPDQIESIDVPKYLEKD